MDVQVDGKEIAVAAGASYGDAARLAQVQEPLAARQNGEIRELGQPVTDAGQVDILTFADPDGRTVFHHTSTHIMAQAVRRLYPGARLAIGPADPDGFFYDMELPRQLGPEDFAAIEAEMAKIAAADYPVVREVISRQAAIELFSALGETYKLEIIERLPEDAQISIYRQGEFVDLCRGPHLASTGPVKAVKLLSVAGAYWAGDESRPMLQRLYGTSFPSEAGLEAHLRLLEEAKRRDHRRLGRELDLFTFHDVAPGFAFWQPNGTILYHELEQFSREVQQRYGYQEVMTPWIFRPDLWQTSGHWGHYKENMFTLQRDEEQFAVNPMNCPAHCVLFGSETRSYRDLPLRFAEYGQLARYERSGTLHGLLRVRSLHQDDAHIYVAPDQIQGEIASVLRLVDRVYGTLGMSYEIKLATRPDDFLGDAATWDRAEADLGAAVTAAGKTFVVSPKEGAFYGPKLEFHVTDALGRKWQCATVQLDWNLPERFDLWYVAADGQRHRPVMIHRAIFGTLERFVGVLLEHFAGAFPAWLAPVQAMVLPIADRHAEYAGTVAAALTAAGLRAEVDARPEKIGYRIAAAQRQKVPYMLVVGDREVEQGLVAVRARSGGDQGARPLGEVVAALKAEVEERRAAG